MNIDLVSENTVAVFSDAANRSSSGAYISRGCKKMK